MQIRSPSTVVQILKRLLQAVATLGGFFGLLMLPVSVGMLVDAIPNREPIAFIFTILLFILDFYLLWLCYYVWFRFSPRAVLHVCGLLGFLALGIQIPFLPSDLDNIWRGVIHLFWILFVIQGYRTLSACLNRLIFNSHAPPPHAV